MPRPYRPGKTTTHIMLNPEIADLLHLIAVRVERTMNAVVVRALRWYADERGMSMPKQLSA